MIAWSVEAFRRSSSITVAVIAAPPGYEEEVERVVGDAAGDPRELQSIHPIVVTGGARRSVSVGLALAEVPARAGLVAIHDAARPLVTADLIDTLVARLLERPDADGVIAAAPVKETIKRARAAPDGGGTEIERTESRDRLWAAQTPQVFRAQPLRDAHDADPAATAAATDDAMLIERAGGRVLIEPTPAENIKVTAQADVQLAELLLAER